MKYQVTGLDIILIVVYFSLILAFGYAYSKKLPKAIKGHFIKGLTLKLICGLGFGWVFVYYYGGGDTTNYFHGASYIYDYVINKGQGFEIFFDDKLLITAGESKMATQFTQRFAGFVNFFAMDSFWSCTLLFSLLSFIGVWLIFLTFYRQFPHLNKQLALAILFMPGVAFWSAGIMKDSICMLFVGVIVYYIQNIFLYNRKKILSAVMVITGFYIIVTLKAYIALALLVALGVYVLSTIKSRIKSPALRAIMMPLLALVIVAVTLLSMRKIGESLERYSLENIVETAQVYQNYHSRTSIAGRGSENRTGSAYTLGEINFNSPVNILTKIPLAINVTFFRPYVWEVRNPVMLLSALESTFILLFTLSILWRTGIRKFFSNIFRSREVVFCLTFALIFGFAVGFTTYNFGSLVRYKTPCIPFFMVSLVILKSLSPKSKPSVKRRTTMRRQVPHPIRQVPN